jgi:hypothetical protein
MILLATCLFGLTLTAVALALPVGTPPEEDRLQVPNPELVSHGQFFMDGSVNVESSPTLPSSSLLHQLEEHVRNEHRAAEEFLRGPTAETLHASNETPLWN